MSANRSFFHTAHELFQHLNPEHEMKLGLERMEWMLQRLGHPERRLQVIHVAGTNGKGSTSMMLSSVLCEANYRVGLFLSPPIIAWNERIQVNGSFISEESFVKWANHLWPFVQEMEQGDLIPPSYYEIWALIAICYFAYEALPDFVILETGLGGRYDATNVVHPLVSVITQIGLDHQQQLGDTLGQIAGEKAGIIKSGVPVVSGKSPAIANEVIKRVANQANALCYQSGLDFTVEPLASSIGRQEFRVNTPTRTYSRLAIHLSGKHQMENAATALVALEFLQQRYAVMIAEEHLELGLLKAYIPGRLERLGDRPLVLIDGAHNRDSMRTTLETIIESYTYRRLIVVSAMMRDKEVDQMLEMLASVTDRLITTEVKTQQRSLTADQLAHRAMGWFSPQVIKSNDSIEVAISHAKSVAQEDDLILVVGSLYLVAEARPLLVKQ